MIGVVSTGSFTTLATVEKLFNNSINDLEQEGRELKYINERMAIFEDGSKVLKYKITNLESLRIARLTHLLIDSDVFNANNGEEMVKIVLLPTVIDKGDYVHLEASDDISERILLFDKEGNKRKFIH